MRKFNTRLFAGLLAVFCCMTALSATAYADGGYYEQSEDGSETPPSSIDSITISTETVRLPEQQGSEALTPDGNLTLIDDILQSAPYASVEEAAENKQFITVQSKNGNYFYIIVDRAAEGENTVHFLNQVDDADLFALLEDGESTEAQTPAVCTCTEKCETGKINTSCPVCSTNMTACSGKEAEPEPDEVTEQPQEKSNTGGLVLFLVVALLGGGGAFYYFKFMKPKQSVKGGTDLEDFDFEDYDEDEPDDAEDTGSDGETEDEEA